MRGPRAERQVIPDLQARSGTAAVIISRTLRSWGLSESKLAEMVAPRLVVLPPGTFYAWMRARGKLGGQNKVPRVSNDRRAADHLLRVAGLAPEIDRPART